MLGDWARHEDADPWGFGAFTDPSLGANTGQAIVSRTRLPGRRIALLQLARLAQLDDLSEVEHYAIEIVRELLGGEASGDN